MIIHILFEGSVALAHVPAESRYAFKALYFDLYKSKKIYTAKHVYFKLE